MLNLGNDPVVGGDVFGQFSIGENTDNDPVLQRMAKHGYVIVCVNVRGGGASFGRYAGLFSDAETRDA